MFAQKYFGLVLNFITHGISGDITVVIARNGEKGNNRAMTAFVVERGTPGFSAGKKENKLFL